MTDGAGTMVIDATLVDALPVPLLPTTRTVKVLVTAAVGVPVSAPVAVFSVRPAGRLPLLIDHTFDVPPAAVNVVL